MNCSEENCSKEAKCKNLCWAHYKNNSRKENKDKYNDYMREYMSKNRDKVNEYHQTEKYKQSHREAQKKYEQKGSL